MADPRALALEVLKQARDSLVQRLTERVLEEREAILADARGESYMGEIESMYEQVGGRLAHINQMLASLPQVETTADFSEPFSPPLAMPLALPPPAKPWRGTLGEGEVPAAETPTAELPLAALVHHVAVPPLNFQAFLAQVEGNELVGAGNTLALLCDLAPERGHACAEVFAAHLAAEAGFLAKAMRLRSELAAENFNAVIMLLYECFGLVGLESIAVIQALREKLLRSEF